MEEGQADARLGGHLQQFHLRTLQAPTRCRDAAILAAVRIAEHHHLHVVACTQVRAVHRIFQQVAQRGGAALEVIHGFKQRCDVERHRAIGIDQATPPRQRQHRQHVAAVMRHGNDVAAQCIPAMPRARIGQRREHRVQALVAFVITAGQCSFATGMRAQQARTAQRIQRLPCIIAAQHRGQCTCMHARFLAYVQPRQVKAEGLHPPQQALHREATGMFATVGAQAVEDQLQVVDQFIRAGIGPFAIVQRGLQARAHAVVEQAVRHVGVARARLHLWQQLLVVRHARLQCVAHAHPFGGLAEQAGQLQQFLLVAPQHGLPLCIQRVADGAGIHVRVAVHVAAHPGTEAQQARQRQLLSIGIAQRLLQRFVQHRNHPVQHLHQVEANVLAFVVDRGPHRRGIGGLPRRRECHAETRGIGSGLARRALAIQVVHQAGHHQLLFFQQRAAHRFGGVRGEHRFDVDARQPLRQLVQAHALRLQVLQRILQAIGLRSGSTRTLVVAAAADAVHALGDVDHLEVRAECTHHGFGLLRRAPGQAIGQLGQRCLVFAPRDGAGAHVLDIIEERGGNLFDQQVADQCTKAAHIIAKRKIGGSEFDAAAVLVHRRRTNLGA